MKTEYSNISFLFFIVSFFSYFCASKCINSIETLKSEMHCNMQY